VLELTVVLDLLNVRAMPGRASGEPLWRSWRVGARVMIVKEFGQLLAQAFIALPSMTEQDCPFEQRLLLLLRQPAPQIGGGRPKREKKTAAVLVHAALFRRHELILPVSAHDRQA
jgi:hypothetical protein